MAHGGSHNVPATRTSSSEPTAESWSQWDPNIFTRKRSFLKHFSEAVFCFSKFFRQFRGRLAVFENVCPTSQQLRFRLLRTWSFTSENSALGMCSLPPLVLCSLPPSHFNLTPFSTPKKLSERVKVIAFPCIQHNSPCRKVRSSEDQRQKPGTTGLAMI